MKNRLKAHFTVFVFSVFFISYYPLLSRAESKPSAENSNGDAPWRFLENSNKSEKEPDQKSEKKRKKQKKHLENESHKSEEKSANVLVAETKETESLKTSKEEKSQAHELELERSDQPRTDRLILNSSDGCYVVEYDNKPGELISCLKPLSLRYTKRSCSNGKIMEIGDVDAAVSCTSSQNIEFKFRTSSEVVSFTVRVSRTKSGRSGLKARYIVTKSGHESTSLGNLLPTPSLRSKEGEHPEEPSVVFKAFGYAALEYEFTSRFGYSAGNSSQTAQADFDRNAIDPSQHNNSFLTNIGVEAIKDHTKLASLFEIGEVYFGDSSSGGAQGTRAGNIFEVRNLYLQHIFTDQLSATGGLVTTFSDPRSFIYNDHTASVQLSYKTDLSEGLIWYGNAAQNRPGATKSGDQYYGIYGTLGFLSKIKGTAFFIHRIKASDPLADLDLAGNYVTVRGLGKYYWFGGTFDYDGLDPLAAQFTAIGNWADTTVAQKSDKLSAYLLDTKWSYSWEAPQIVLSIEGLLTSGAKDARDAGTGNTILGRRKAFVSPVGAAYLMNIATSDGVDDAPGTPKQSIIANLGLDEGLRALVFGINHTLNKRISLIARFGSFSSVERSSVLGRFLGREYDLGGVYQLSSSTTLQMDYGRFLPGTFYSKHDSAQLFSTKLKFTF